MEVFGATYELCWHPRRYNSVHAMNVRLTSLDRQLATLDVGASPRGPLK